MPATTAAGSATIARDLPTRSATKLSAFDFHGEDRQARGASTPGAPFLAHRRSLLSTLALAGALSFAAGCSSSSDTGGGTTDSGNPQNDTGSTNDTAGGGDTGGLGVALNCDDYCA